MRTEVKKSLLLSGIFLLLFIVFNILISNALFIVKIEITKYNMIVSLLLCIFILLWVLKKFNLLSLKKFYNIIIALILPIALIVGSLFVNSKIMDFTFDGNTYHKATIGLLKEGWNPLYETAAEFDNGRENKIYIENSSSELWTELWTDCYARATHVYQANAYALTNNIESGKSINTLSIIALFLIIFSYLALRFKKIVFPFIFALCCITYSVVSAQYLTVYIDFFVYIYLLLLLFSFFVIEFRRNEKELNFGLLIYSLALLMLINIKFNSFAYAGIFCLGYYFYYIYKLIKKREKEQKFFVKFTTISAINVIVGVFIIGLSVYPKNFIEYGNPFYPLYGENKVDIITENQPAEFENLPTKEKYTRAMFSKTENMAKASGRETEYKIPFAVSKDEMNYIRMTDTRISGNGVLFSGIFIISLILLILTSIKMYHYNKKIFIMASIPLAITFLMIFLLSESWWARYFPQTYFIVLIVIFYLYLLKGKFYKVLLVVLFILVLANNGITLFKATEYSYDQNKLANNEFRLLEENVDPNNQFIVLQAPVFIGSLYDIYDNLPNYKFQLVPPEEKIDLSNTLMNGLVLWKWQNNE